MSIWSPRGSLKELNLQDTMISDEGVSWLATALGRGNLPRLESLYLMGCANVRCTAPAPFISGSSSFAHSISFILP